MRRPILWSMVLLLAGAHPTSFSYAQDPIFIPPKSTQKKVDPERVVKPDPALPGAIFLPPAKLKPNEKPKDKAGKDVPAKADPSPPGVPPLKPAVKIRPPADLSRKLVKKIDGSILPALRQERHQEFLSGMSELVGKLDRKTLQIIEDYAQQQGVSLSGHFADLLMKSIEQQAEIPAANLRLDALEFVNSGLRRHIEAELDDLSDHASMQTAPQLPDNWRATEELFWDLHVWNNRMTNVYRMSQYAVEAQQRLMAQAQKRNDRPTLNRLQPTVLLNNRVEQSIRHMIEGETVLRIAELRKAESALKTSKDFEERLAAAFALELHALKLEEVFENYPPGSFIRTSLNSLTLPDECAQLITSGRESGKDVVSKAVLLRQGAHWWLRGRYGEGPLVHGLLKHPKAVESENVMFGLYMPKKRPEQIGTVTTENTLAPGYERRHYFTWAVEKRDFISSKNQKKGPVEVLSSVTEPTRHSKRGFY